MKDMVPVQSSNHVNADETLVLKGNLSNNPPKGATVLLSGRIGGARRHDIWILHDLVDLCKSRLDWQAIPQTDAVKTVGKAAVFSRPRLTNGLRSGSVVHSRWAPTVGNRHR